MRTKKDDILEKLDFLKKKFGEVQGQLKAVEKELADFERDERWVQEAGAGALKECTPGAPHSWKVVTLRRDIKLAEPRFSWQEPPMSLGYEPGQVNTAVQYECVYCRAELRLVGSRY